MVSYLQLSHAELDGAPSRNYCCLSRPGIGCADARTGRGKSRRLAKSATAERQNAHVQ